MKARIWILLAAAITINVAGSCKSGLSKTSDSLPYASLTKQRADLAKKPRLNATRLLDSSQIIRDLEYFASDTCEGRKPGTRGHYKTQEKIMTRMREAGLDSFGNTLIQSFTVSTPGINLIGWIKGTSIPEKYVVVSAHYDHLGKTGSGETYYGADDNASGTACLLALAKYFKLNPQSYSIIIAAFDREENGMMGAYNFVSYLQRTNRLSSVKFNLNLDMIARSDKNEIFACGLKNHPAFKYVIDSVQSKTSVNLLMGHDGLTSGEDWTHQSDHAAFHDNGIPFIYVGVEDHVDYHKTTDTYSRINYRDYIENCNLIVQMVKALKP